jgi:hypothetical protein
VHNCFLNRVSEVRFLPGARTSVQLTVLVHTEPLVFSRSLSYGVHGGYVRHRSEPPRSLVAGVLDDHLDGSAHAHDPARKQVPTPMAPSEIFSARRIRVFEARLVALVGRDVELSST